MLRITTIDNSGSPLVLKLEGKLLESWIGELDRACRSIVDGARPAILDLSGVSFIDVSGRIALSDLRRRGVRLTGCTPLVAELLKENER